MHAAHPEQRVIAQRDRDDGHGPVGLVAILVHPHAGAFAVPVHPGSTAGHDPRPDSAYQDPPEPTPGSAAMAARRDRSARSDSRAGREIQPKSPAAVILTDIFCPRRRFGRKETAPAATTARISSTMVPVPRATASRARRSHPPTSSDGIMVFSLVSSPRRTLARGISTLPIYPPNRFGACIPGQNQSPSRGRHRGAGLDPPPPVRLKKGSLTDMAKVIGNRPRHHQLLRSPINGWQPTAGHREFRRGTHPRPPSSASPRMSVWLAVLGAGEYARPWTNPENTPFSAVKRPDRGPPAWATPKVEKDKKLVPYKIV